MRCPSLLFCLPALLSAAPPAVRHVTIMNPDGPALQATLELPRQPGPLPLVIFALPPRAGRDVWKPLVDLLSRRGIATLAMAPGGPAPRPLPEGKSLEISEDSQSAARTAGFARTRDEFARAEAWAQHQPGLDPHRLALAGTGEGAFAALLAAPAVHPLAVLALSPAGGAELDPDPRSRLLLAVESAQIPVLIMASRGSRNTAGAAELLKDLPGVYVKLVPGGAPGASFLPAEAGTLAGWLAEYLNVQPFSEKQIQ